MMESIDHFHTALFIGVMCVVQTMGEICPYSDPGCSCGPYITCYNLQEIPPINTTVDSSQVTSLIFEEGNITSISDNSLPPGLSSLNLYHLPLANISDDAFDASAATLQDIYISRANLYSFPTALKKLTNLTHLSFIDSVIQDWDTATLNQSAATLENLALINVSLPAWPSWISDLYLLRQVDLSWNPLRNIPNDAFSSINDSLTDLNLKGTDLTHIPGALSTLLSLRILDLQNNNFTDLSEFQYITGSPFAHNLSVLYLDFDGLTRVANFSSLAALITLSLSSNRISFVPAGSLPTSLTTLYLSNNSLASVPEDVASMSKLSSLYLSTNIIGEIEQNAFPSSLTILNLANNNLTIITNTTFRNLNLVTSLSLTSNPISTISSAAFSDLVSLQYLYLIGSQLTEIPLALALLNPRINLYFTTTEQLSCPCPPNRQLSEFFTSVGYPAIFPDVCEDGQSVTSYLSGQCQ
ncbi:unnamed protein product [Candidula unifasciata]|uniref:Uncharacterized protein n=1 Tax=Candidula unifasciata TaxID=100452 RepID=A0A8S3YVQ6_9EUPU|nr:unnamed protein product [Candidula unifasciata]